jgi:hypothetical protein
LVDAGYGNVYIEVAGDTRDEVDVAARMVRQALESPAPEADRVSVAFWVQGNRGGDVRMRWAGLCSAHFIMDPEELFGRGGAYILDVLTWDGDRDDKWRLVILEDSGELIASDARTLAGQALSRLVERH